MWSQAFLFLLVVGTVGAAVLISFVAALRRKHRTFKISFLSGSVITGLYMALIVGVAAATPDRALRLGEEKYICELDCHLAYSVVGMRREGRLVRVRLNVRFDKATISERRSLESPLYPGWRWVQLTDAAGKRYRPVSLGDLSRTLLPGEQYQTELVFDVDPAAQGLILYLADADFTKWLLLGSDNAPFRRPVGFRLSQN